MKANLFIAGTVKGGTTWLYDVLSTSNEVYGPELKEPHFFCENRTSRSYVSGVGSRSEYDRRNSHNMEVKYVMDGSATYVSEIEIPSRIESYNSDAKVIIMLRHPVRRAFSQYQMDLREGGLLKEFSDEVEEDYAKDGLNTGRMYIGLSTYYPIVKEYLDIFGDNLLVISYGDLRNDKENVLLSVCEFLGIKNDFSIEDVEQHKNVAALPRNEISRILLSNDFIRNFVKIVIPKRMRSWVKVNALTVGSNMKLEPEINSYLYRKYFAEDSKMLFGLLGREMWTEDADI